MIFTTVAALLLLQNSPNVGGSLVRPFGPWPNFDPAVFPIPGCPAGIKLRSVAAGGDANWLGLTEEGIAVGRSGYGDLTNTIPSHLRFSAICGDFRKGGGITTDGRVYWWAWNSNGLNSGHTDEKFTQIVISYNQDNENWGHLLGLSEQGALKYIGDASLISPLPPAPAGKYESITGSALYPWYAAVSTAGKLSAWGDTSDGQQFSYDLINGQVVDWTSMCTFGGYNLLGLRSDGTTESIGSPYSLSGGPYIEVNAEPSGNRMFGIKEDGTLCGEDGGENFSTYPGSFQSLTTTPYENRVTAIQTNDVEPVLANPSSFESIYEQSQSYPNQLIQLETGTYDFSNQALNNSTPVRIYGTEKSKCIINMQGRTGETGLSIENCTIQINGPVFCRSNIYAENCDIHFLSEEASFQQELGWEFHTLIATDCNISGSSSPLTQAQSASAYFHRCTFQNMQTIFRGSGSVAVVECLLPPNLNLGQNSLIELTSDLPYAADAFVDFFETELTGVTGDRGPVLRCDSPVKFSTRVWNIDASNCNAIFGGAFWFNNADVEVNRSQFLQNQAELEGNAIYAQNGSSVEIFDCSFVQNNSSPKWGITGAIHAHYSVIDAVDCLFASNGEFLWVPVNSLIYSLDSYFCENDPSFYYPGIVDLGGNQVAENCDDFDCNSNGILDDEEIENGEAADCNFNGIPDDCDIDNAFETDCNGNLIPDSCDITDGKLSDCDSNNIPDVCTILEVPTADSNQDGILDVCQCITDINSDGFTDFTDLLQLLSCWGSNTEGVCNFADVSEDGVIDFADVLIMLNGFGPC